MTMQTNTIHDTSLLEDAMKNVISDIGCDLVYTGKRFRFVGEHKSVIKTDFCHFSPQHMNTIVS